VLIIGASGGVGTAYLQLGRLAGLEIYGIASAGKHHVLAEHGVTPIEVVGNVVLLAPELLPAAYDCLA
jgi:NADPH:quinone reductase-like Zn-dependent oxidoreductase